MASGMAGNDGFFGPFSLQSLIGSDGIRTEALLLCFDAFSWREPGSTSLENAIKASFRLPPSAAS
jgi:hypothetical protein